MATFQEQVKSRWQAAWNAAEQSFSIGDEATAETKLRECAALSPETWCKFGMDSMNKGEMEQALKRFNEALEFARTPQTKAVCHNNIGTIFANNGHRVLAMAHFQKAIELLPNYPDAYANVALIHKWNGQTILSLVWLGKALKINPLHQQAAFTRALVLLLRGDLAEGWEAYEARWRTKGAGIRKLEMPWPEWNGKNGKSVLIYGEQGAGDCIQMMRYAKVMKESGLRVQAVFQSALKSLAEHTGFFERVYVPGEVMTNFDCHIPAMSLPRIFKTTLETIPLAKKYIPMPQLSEAMEYGDGLNVGIFWRGSSAFKQDIWRSSQLTQWAEVLSVPGITFHSLQVGDGELEAGLFPQIKTYPAPADYLETARRMAGLDLVITIDTSVAHLAGALGIETWMLTPYAPDFRWLLKREDSPWYKSLRLFRQVREFDWETVMQRIAEALR